MRLLFVMCLCFGLVIGVSAQNDSPYFDAGGFQFGLDRTLFTNDLIDGGLATYPAGIQRLIAKMPVMNIADGVLLEIRWFYNGQPETETERFVYNGTDTIVTTLTNLNGLAAGEYTYRISLDADVFERSVTLVADPFIYPFHYGRDCTAYSSSVLGYPVARYFSTDPNIAMQIHYANFLPDTGVLWEVLRNGEVLETSSLQRTFSGTGYYCFNYFDVENGLGTALYEFILRDAQSGSEIHREAQVVAAP
jgi:hypothetical protein